MLSVEWMNFRNFSMCYRNTIPSCGLRSLRPPNHMQPKPVSVGSLETTTLPWLEFNFVPMYFIMSTFLLTVNRSQHFVANFLISSWTFQVAMMPLSFAGLKNGKSHFTHDIRTCLNSMLLQTCDNIYQREGKNSFGKSLISIGFMYVGTTWTLLSCIWFSDKWTK